MILSEGLGNRIRQVSRALTWGFPQAVWPVDKHCPVLPAQVFAQPVEGLELIPVDGPPYPPLKPREGSNLTEQQAWERIASSLGFTPNDTTPHGVVFRGFHPQATPFDSFRPKLQQFANTTTGVVAVLADSHRAEISEILGDRALPQVSPELTEDGARTPEDVLLYLQDWLQFLSAKNSISNYARASALWPLRFIQAARST